MRSLCGIRRMGGVGHLARAFSPLSAGGRKPGPSAQARIARAVGPQFEGWRKIAAIGLAVLARAFSPRLVGGPSPGALPQARVARAFSTLGRGPFATPFG